MKLDPIIFLELIQNRTIDVTVLAPSLYQLDDLLDVTCDLGKQGICSKNVKVTESTPLCFRAGAAKYFNLTLRIVESNV